MISICFIRTKRPSARTHPQSQLAPLVLFSAHLQAPAGQVQLAEDLQAGKGVVSFEMRRGPTRASDSPLDGVAARAGAGSLGSAGARRAALCGEDRQR